jgi:hypothetical protein
MTGKILFVEWRTDFERGLARLLEPIGLLQSNDVVVGTEGVVGAEGIVEMVIAGSLRRVAVRRLRLGDTRRHRDRGAAGKRRPGRRPITTSESAPTRSPASGSTAARAGVKSSTACAAGVGSSTAPAAARARPAAASTAA